MAEASMVCTSVILGSNENYRYIYRKKRMWPWGHILFFVFASRGRL